jgi:hypothetical protein
MKGYENILYSRSYIAPLSNFSFFNLKDCIPPSLLPTFVILVLMTVASFCGVGITIGLIFAYQRVKSNNFEKLPD